MLGMQERMKIYCQTYDSMEFKTATSTCWWQMLLEMCGEKGNYLMRSSQTVGTNTCTSLSIECLHWSYNLQLPMGSGKEGENLGQETHLIQSHPSCKLNTNFHVVITFLNPLIEWIVTYRLCAAIICQTF